MTVDFTRTSFFSLAALLAAGTAHAAWAQDAPKPELTGETATAEPDAGSDAPAKGEGEGGIVVIGQRLRGEVKTDVAPELQLDEKDVASYGASNIGDLLAALAPQTGGGRGRGGGQPVVLLNGRRISGFGELRNIPSEAILRVDVLPEQVALQFGYAADQRVVNFILKPDFSAVTLEAEIGAPFAGGRWHQEYEASVTKLSPNTRLNISGEYSYDGLLTEAERDIVAVPRTDDGVDQTPYRTLLPQQRVATLEATANRYLSDTMSATLNGKLDMTRSRSFLGLADTNLIISPVTLYSRSFPEFGALERKSETIAGHVGALVDGELGAWRWSVTGNYDLVDSETLTQRGIDAQRAQAFVDGGGDVASVFPPASVIGANADRSDSTNRNLESTSNFSGPVFDTGAGKATGSLTLSAQQFTIHSRTTRLGTLSLTDLERGQKSARGNIDIPLARVGEGILGFVGSLSANANLAYRDLSDFGSLTTYGYGVNWAPAEWLQFTASSSTEEGAPSLSQLGGAVIATPNVPVFDFATGDTVFVTTIAGGNPILIADRRNVVDIGANIRFKKPDGLSLVANFTRIRADDPISSFPSLSPEIEAAFPDRITRNVDGQLVSLYLRAVNYLREETDRVRWGLNYSSGGGRGGGGRGGGGSGPRFGGGGPGGRDVGPQPLNWRFSLYHTLVLRDAITISEGLPVLDRLDGSATGSGGGQPRHSIVANAGLFKDGFGGFLQASYSSATRVDGDSNGVATPGLEFGSIFNLSLRAFINFDQRESLVERFPWLKGSRLRIAIDNLTDSVQEVRDTTGAVPLRFQHGFIDPVGRAFEISFRKQF